MSFPLKIVNHVALSLLLIYILLEAIYANTDFGPIFPLEDGRDLYRKFIEKHNRKFSDKSDYETRYQNFLNTLRKINENNAQFGSVKVGPSATADLSDFERMQRIMQETTPEPDPDLVAADLPSRYKLENMFNFM